MTNDRLLQIYLNDHLAGATAGMELAKRARSENAGSPFAAPLRKLTEAIVKDQGSLRALMQRLGVPVNPAKMAAAWAVEKIGRLKLNGSLLAYSPLSRVVEIESLLAGVEGKAAMWRALLVLADSDDRIPKAELERLLTRATRQR